MRCFRRHCGKFHENVDASPPHPHNSAPDDAPVAQLDRVPGYEPGGREFESLRAHHLRNSRPRLLFFLCASLSPASLVDTIVPVAGKLEATLQARLAVRSITTGFCNFAGITRWPAGNGNFSSWCYAPMPGSNGCHTPRPGRSNHRQHRWRSDNLPALLRRARAGHRLVRHCATLHALEHLLRGQRRSHRQQHGKHASKQCHSHPSSGPAGTMLLLPTTAPSVKQALMHRGFPCASRT